jgi:hypothetical protein
VSRILCVDKLCVLVTDGTKLDNVSVLHNVCRYCTTCVGTAQDVSVLHNVCRYCTTCVGTAQCVSALHNMFRYST